MEVTKALFQKRRSRRKEVKLRGICICRSKPDAQSKKTDEVFDVTIENISKHGIGFRFITPVEVAVNDILTVKFALESDKRATVITKDVVVKWVKTHFVGAEFTRPIDDYESEIDYYLSGAQVSIYDLRTR